MKSKLTFLFATLALAVATAASSYNLKIYNPIWVGSNELKPGDYRVQVEGDKAVIRNTMHSKEVIEVPAKMETNPEKFDTTALRTEDVNGKPELREISVGGTHTKIMLEPASTQAGGSE